MNLGVCVEIEEEGDLEEIEGEGDLEFPARIMILFDDCKTLTSEANQTRTHKRNTPNHASSKAPTISRWGQIHHMAKVSTPTNPQPLPPQLQESPVLLQLQITSRSFHPAQTSRNYPVNIRLIHRCQFVVLPAPKIQCLLDASLCQSHFPTLAPCDHPPSADDAFPVDSIQ